MNRIISYELCCKGSWSILYNLFINKEHSFLVSTFLGFSEIAVQNADRNAFRGVFRAVCELQ